MEFLDGGSERAFKTIVRVDYENNNDTNDKSDDFVKFDIVTAMNMKNGENESEWWIRKGTKRNAAFHQAMMATYSFPSKISCVQAWHQQDKISGQTIVFVVVIGNSLINGCKKKVVQSFIEISGTKNLACASVGIKVNSFISTEILGLTVKYLDVTPLAHTASRWNLAQGRL